MNNPTMNNPTWNLPIMGLPANKTQCLHEKYCNNSHELVDCHFVTQIVEFLKDPNSNPELVKLLGEL